MAALRSRSRSSLFLLEMIIVILVFAVSSAVCASLFVSARLASLQSSRLTMAVGLCQNAAECLRAAGDDPGLLEEVLGARALGGGVYEAGYDADGHPAGPDGARYLLTIVTARSEGGLLHAAITLDEADGADRGGADPLYSLKTTQYHPSQP